MVEGFKTNLPISIHAPAKGATLFLFVLFTQCFNFNPRSREGSDFQRATIAQSVSDFNPRSREGSDVLFIYICQYSIISIHAPAKGATSFYLSLNDHHSFQSTLPRRERLYVGNGKMLHCGFQSTLPRRERRAA